MLFLYGLYAFMFVVLFGVLISYVALMLTASWDAWALARANRYAGPDRWE